jgi:hypothetical protein
VRDALTSHGEAVEPPRGVVPILSPQQRDPQLHRGETRAADRVRVQGAAIQLATLHEQVGELAVSSDLMVPTQASAITLSSASPTVPIEGSMPRSAIRSV